MRLFPTISFLICALLSAPITGMAFQIVNPCSRSCTSSFSARQQQQLGRVILGAASNTNSNTNTNEQQRQPTLSGLVTDMLQAQREMSQDMKEIEKAAVASEAEKDGMPPLGQDGVYQVFNEGQLSKFHAAHSDKLVILKISSPMCQACRMLKQKFRHWKFADSNAPVVLADITVSNNKHLPDVFRDYVTTTLKVHRIPTILLYAPNGQLVDNIACDPDGCSWSKLKQQMVAFVNEWTTTTTTSSVVDEKLMTSSRRILTRAEHAVACSERQRQFPLRFFQNRMDDFFANRFKRR